MSRFALLLCVAALAACDARESSPASRTSSARVGSLSSDDADVACRFRVTAESASAQAPEEWEWFLWRTRDRIETCEARSDTAEVWTRNATGRIESHERVFHRDRRVIEFHPGDLAALDSSRTWDAIASVVEPAMLGERLRRTGSATVAGRPAENYEGTIDGVALEVTWVPSLRLPSRLHRSSAGSSVTLELAEVQPIAAAPWPRQDASDYKRHDYADIGDGHLDPFLRNLGHRMTADFGRETRR